MPDLGKVSLSPSSSGGALARCPTLKPLPTSGDEMGFKTLDQGCCDYCDERPGGGGGGGGGDDDACNEDSVRVSRRICGVRVKRGANNGKCLLEDYVGAWVQKKVDLGFSPSHCFLPFLVGAKKMVECLGCDRVICPGEEVFCSVRNCQGVYHLTCAKEKLGLSDFRKFKCPQHACFLCKQKFQWRCVRCSITAHDKCAAWPDEVIHLANQPRRAICWRHPADWRLDKENMAPTSDMEEVFSRLPLPYVDEEFKIDSTWKDLTENKLEPTPYVHIRRNVYLVKKKRNDADVDVGCTNCKPMCGEDCVCRVQCISCSKACHCPENCSNRPFRKDKKIKIVKTELCGWGVEAAEPIKKGEFVIEYIGEVIDDALCEQRLWDMKYKGVKNFYMCEIRKDFTIDATFKGNASRFLNHSCEPNCVLEKWQAEGELRVGVFAARSIKIGEPLTYDYRFVQFGPEVRCFCGAENCQGFLGTKRNVGILDLCWGAKRKRSSSPCLALVTT